MLFCHVTTRIEDRENDDLLFELDGDGTPYVCMIDADGAVLGRHRGPHSLAGYERMRAAVAEMLAARERADRLMDALEDEALAGEDEASRRAAAAAEEAVRLALIDADIAACASGAIPFEELEFALEDRGAPTQDQQRRVTALRADEEIGNLETSFRKVARNAPEVIVDGLLDRIATMHAEQRVPGRPDAAAIFWVRLAQWADRRGKPGVRAECIAALERLPEDCRPEKELARLRAAGG